MRSISWTGITSLSQPYPCHEPVVLPGDGFTGSYINLRRSQVRHTIAPCSMASRLPYPNFTDFYIDSDWHGYSHYNAMNVKFEHRAGDLAVTAVYTWAKSKDDKSAAAGVGATGTGYQGFMDNHHPELDYGLSDFDVDQRFVASYVYQLALRPRQEDLAAAVNRAANLLVGGWETNRHHDLPGGISLYVIAQRYPGH